MSRSEFTKLKLVMENRVEIGFIPPPIPLKWQLTLQSDEFDTDHEDHGMYQCKDPLVVVLKTTECDSNNTTDHKNHNTTLKQYEKYSYNKETVNVMISGLTRIQSVHHSKTISHDINYVIFKFYYQEKYKYLSLTFKLYQKFNNNICSGKQLVESINKIINNEANALLICDDLIKYKYIKFHSCLTEFNYDSLSHNSSISEFKANNNYFYQFRNEIIEQYSKLSLNDN
eukprot:106627_1